MRPIRLAFVLTALGVAAAALTACNTFRGMGDDVESVGHAIEDAGD